MMTVTYPSFRLLYALSSAISNRPANVLLLSGGVDSSTLLAIALETSVLPKVAITVGLDTSPGEGCPIHGPDIPVPCNGDLAAAHKVADWLGLDWQPIRLSQADALDALIELCLALRSFDLGNLNNIPLYVSAIHAAGIGADRIWTGDDADSLFGGYQYQRGEQDWPAYLARRIPTVRPPFTDIAGIIGVTPVYPWLQPAVLDVARSLHRNDVLMEIPIRKRPAMPSFMDQFDPDPRQATTRLWGKMPVRQLAEMHLPDDIAWRPKTDLQFGSGMCALEAPLAVAVTPDDRERLNRTGIQFFNDAHRGLYLRFEQAGGTVSSPVAGQYACASCGGGVDIGHKHCPTCGAWPADQR
jgi:asparagine synthetase B (glutamine-hydrolysing)